MSIVSAGAHPDNDFLGAAIDYSARGWSVIPVVGKRAAGPWKQFQSAPPDVQVLRRLFSQPDITGLAVILGGASGGLACRDFDAAAAYWRWAEAYPLLAGTLPTVRTARGFHVYFTGPDGFTTLADGEYRADAKHYSLAPPSLHPDGPRYCWLVPLPAGELPTLDPIRSGLVPRDSGQAGHPDTHHPDTHHPATHTHCMCPTQSDDLDGIIAATLPSGPGERNRKLFDLARHLKRIMPDADRETLRNVVRRWHALALPLIRTKDWLETRTDFAIAWDKVKLPAGALWSQIVAAAEQRPLADGFEGAAGKLLNLCAALQDCHGPGRPWPLSCRKAAEAIGVGHDTAARFIKLLIIEGVIEQVAPAGAKGSGRAAEYRLRGGNGR